MLEKSMLSKIWLWATLLFLLPIFSYAHAQNNSQVLELYVKSGMEKQVQQIPSVMQALFDQSVPEDDQARKLPKEVLSAMRASVPAAFAPERLKETILAELTRRLTAQDIKDTLQWLDSPIGKKCTQLEEAASTPEAQDEMQQYAGRLHDSPPTAERLKVLRELDSAATVTGNAVEMAIQTQAAVALAIIATLPVEQQKPREEVYRDIEKTRPAIEALVRSQTLISQLWAYRSLTDAEIKRYTQFAKSPAGSKYSSAAMAAFDKANLEGAIKWGKLIGDAMKEMKNKSEA
jgi:hypothetical protein